ncbi:MAG: GNAT family N-acetyltransferase [Anaerolineaceae bacterium]|nr:GNAT family N-acetyltransferase [Anaerolineaceae bacterium]
MFKSARVLLRPFRREDMARQWEFENDPELWFWDGHTPAPAKLESLLAHYDENKNSENEVSFAIEIDKLYVGHCGLHSFDQTNQTCELSVEIGDKGYWGKGYGREIVNLLLQYAFNHRHVNRVWLETHSENERAMRCYRACGFVEEGRLRQHLWLDGRYVDRVIMGILREDYLQ